MVVIDRGGSEAAHVDADDITAGDIPDAIGTSAIVLFSFAVGRRLGCSLRCRFGVYFLTMIDCAIEVGIATAIDMTDERDTDDANHNAVEPCRQHNPSPTPTPKPKTRTKTKTRARTMTKIKNRTRTRTSPSPSPASNPSPKPKPKPDKKRDAVVEYMTCMIRLVLMNDFMEFSLLVIRKAFGVTISLGSELPFEFHAIANVITICLGAYRLWRQLKPFHKDILKLLGRGLRASVARLGCARASGTIDETSDNMTPRTRGLGEATPEIVTHRPARTRPDRPNRSPTCTVSPRRVSRTPSRQREGAGSTVDEVKGDRRSVSKRLIVMTKNGNSPTSTTIPPSEGRREDKKQHPVPRRPTSAQTVNFPTGIGFPTRPTADGCSWHAPARFARCVTTHEASTRPGHKEIFCFTGEPQKEARSMDSPQPPNRRITHMDVNQAQMSAAMESASRLLVAQGSEIHCCTVNLQARREMWVRAQYFEDVYGNAVPGVFVYLPVTVLRPSYSEFSTDQRRKWYVQPGGKGGRKEWSEEDGRVIWEVPQASMFGKMLAEPDEVCDKCRRKGRRCSWTPDRLECLCDYCADAPRRHLDGYDHAHNLGFNWARACDCLAQ